MEGEMLSYVMQAGPTGVVIVVVILFLKHLRGERAHSERIFRSFTDEIKGLTEKIQEQIIKALLNQQDCEARRKAIAGVVKDMQKEVAKQQALSKSRE